MPGFPRVDGRWRRQVQRDRKEVRLLVCEMKLHFVQGSELGLGRVQVALVVSPRAGDSHKVGGEFAEDQFQLLMCWFL